MISKSKVIKKERIRRINLLLFSVTVLVLMIGLTSSVSAVAAGGDGTAKDPYQITNCEELQDMSLNLTAHYVLANDIDCSDTANWNDGAGFDPIGDASEKFTGTLDGQNHTITDLYINRGGRSASYVEYGEDYVGLFGCIQGADIRNVALQGIDVTGNYVVGGLVGISYAASVTNCYANGNVKGNHAVGGLVGGSNYGTITSSYATANVTGITAPTYEHGSYYVGGLVGYNYGTITNSYATGNVQCDYVAGGLVGHNPGTITDSHATGNVKGNHVLGGLVGNSSGTVTNSYATGNARGYSILGGLVGNSSGTVANSYATGSAIGTGFRENVGGLVGDNSGTITDCYATGNAMGYYAVGGLVGSNPGTIRNSYATGSVAEWTNRSKSVGGLVGSNCYGSITNSYATGTVPDGSSAGGLVGYNGEKYFDGGVISNSYFTDSAHNNGVGTLEEDGESAFSEISHNAYLDSPDWYFANVWVIDEGVHYPHLQWQTKEID